MLAVGGSQLALPEAPEGVRAMTEDGRVQVVGLPACDRHRAHTIGCLDCAGEVAADCGSFATYRQVLLDAGWPKEGFGE